jgi:hypothetical protein
MALPVLLALAAIQGFSSYKQAEATEGAARLQKELDNIDAGYIDYDAHEAEVFGVTEGVRHQTYINKTLSEQQSVFAAQGVDVSYGTAKEIQDETRLVGTLNVIDMRASGIMKSIGLKRKAQAMRSGANMQYEQTTMNAKARENAGYIEAGSTAFRGYTQTFGTNPDLLGKSNKTSTRY